MSKEYYCYAAAVIDKQWRDCEVEQCRHCFVYQNPLPIAGMLPPAHFPVPAVRYEYEWFQELGTGKIHICRIEHGPYPSED